MKSQSVGAVGRPAWFNARLKGGDSASDEAIAYLDKAFQGTEPISANTFLKAQSIVNAALVSAGGDVELLQENSIILGHAALVAMAHDKLQSGLRDVDQLNEVLRAAACLHAVRQDKAVRFAAWLPQLEAWERSHDDWSGLNLYELFKGKTPLAPLPEIWMGREGESANLAQESLEEWRAAESQPLKINDVGKPGKPSSVWIMQTIEQPEVREGMETFALFSAFRGRCSVSVNGDQVASFESEEPHYFSVPLNFTDRQCMLVVHLKTGRCIQHAPFPIWLAIGKNRPL